VELEVEWMVSLETILDSFSGAECGVDGILGSPSLKPVFDTSSGARGGVDGFFRNHPRAAGSPHAC